MWRHRRAHPRAGGENLPFRVSSLQLFGSSPRGRGKLCAALWQALDVGLIPARAGKTGWWGPFLVVRPAHPRAGGENEIVIALVRSGTGSSPRGRGKRHQRLTLVQHTRLIPARAGKTSPNRGATCKTWAHPRAGGENGGGGGGGLGAFGSSPRGRGKRRMVLTTGWPVRLIPARAGKTITRTSSRSRRRAHPRAGGENGTLAVQDLSATDSSPRGRGKLAVSVQRVAVGGLIPARAGKTKVSGISSPTGTAHPRAGGENAHRVRSVVRACGSSPRGRGKLHAGGVGNRRSGLIPARAGKTARRRRRRVPHRAHPRAGGENPLSVRVAVGDEGSSPRGRGKLNALITGLQTARLIPARAGKTGHHRRSTLAGRAHPRAGGENDQDDHRSR